MIITVTMNPAIDKTIDIKQLEQGGLNRVTHVESDVGGKGINVSKAIAALGGKSVATGFVAGHSGKMIRRVLSDMEIEQDFIEITGETRTNIKIVESTGVVTEFNEPGPKVEEAEVKALLQKLEEYAGADTLFVLAGSIPQGVDKAVYRQIIELVHKKGSKVLLDADGEAFASAVEAAPDIVKPNWDELMMYVGKYGNSEICPASLYTAEQNQDIQDQDIQNQDIQDQDIQNRDIQNQNLQNQDIRNRDIQNRNIQELNVQHMADLLLSKGIETLVVSMGAYGALFCQKSCTIRCPGLKVAAHSTVGAGDAMVAALAYGWEEKLPFEETAKLSMAAAAGAVMTVGTKPPAKEVVDSLLLQVEFI